MPRVRDSFAFEVASEVASHIGLSLAGSGCLCLCLGAALVLVLFAAAIIIILYMYITLHYMNCTYYCTQIAV